MRGSSVERFLPLLDTIIARTSCAESWRNADSSSAAVAALGSVFAS